MHRVDPSGMNLATEIEWRHHGYVVMIDTVCSSHRKLVYDVFNPKEEWVGRADSLREAAQVIADDQQSAGR